MPFRKWDQDHEQESVCSALRAVPKLIGSQTEWETQVLELLASKTSTTTAPNQRAHFFESNFAFVYSSLDFLLCCSAATFTPESLKFVTPMSINNHSTSEQFRLQLPQPILAASVLFGSAFCLLRPFAFTTRTSSVEWSSTGLD
jgi:hypothetical protein